MPSTSKGYRYPAATDSLANTDLWIHNLADDINGNIKGDKVTLTGTGAATATINYTFAFAYPNVPRVTVTPVRSDALYVASAYNIAATGLSICIRRVDGAVIPSGATVDVQIIAVPA